MAKTKKYYILHKPYGYLSQFSKLQDKKTLADLLDVDKDIYPVGRLDENSEGLLLLSNDKSLTETLLNPTNAHSRTYLVQVEGQITKKALKNLETGIEINLPSGLYTTLPAIAKKTSQPSNILERNPAVKSNLQTSWIKLTLTEGKNRQVRRMTAAIGFPTLRLIRSHIEDLEVFSIPLGEYKRVEKQMLIKKLKL